MATNNLLATDDVGANWLLEKRESLRDVHLVSRGKYDIPTEIGALTNLQSVTITDWHYLKHLPDAMSSLVHLTSLNVSRNLRMSIPHWMGAMTTLRCVFPIIGFPERLRLFLESNVIAFGYRVL